MSLGMEKASLAVTCSAKFGPGAGKINVDECRMNYRPLIAVIGDSWTAPGSDTYELAYWLGYTLNCQRYRIITGSEGGIMEAVARGAFISPYYRDGDVNRVIGGYGSSSATHTSDVCMATSREMSGDLITPDSDAVIAMGGGTGTLTQLARAWALNKLIIGYKVRGWSGRVADRPMDLRRRFENMPDDQVYGVCSEKEVLEKLELLSRYI